MAVASNDYDGIFHTRLLVRDMCIGQIETVRDFL